jgi:beta-phosphoglucomutase family hydrolase
MPPLRPPCPAPRALIFDCDGTLADTMPLHVEAWQRIARRHQFDFPRERCYALGGIPTRDILRIIRAEQGLSLDPLAVALEKEHEFLPMIPEVQPVHCIVNIAREHLGKVPMAVASGGMHRIIDRVLDHLGILQWFQTVVTSEHVVHQKPAPDIFLEAARRLGVPPELCRAYEDTDIGLQAIRAAGMEAVDVRTLVGTEANPTGSSL